MDQQHWQTIQSILDQVLDLDLAEQETALMTACQGNSELIAEVRSLLIADQKATAVFDNISS